MAYGSYKFGNSIRLIDALKLGISFGAKVTRYIDDGNLLKFNNTESLSYAIKSWSFALSYTNGSYADMDKVDFFFLDEYRQLLTFSVGYDF